ncbi:MAG: HDOD domain-containing protein [Deltaproteobacteria bacterium]|nr:HDOD domain-containing protein [Deltaproteobacteria bacterium]
MSSSDRVRALFVDDDPRLLSHINRLMKRLPMWEARTAGSGIEAMETLERESFDVVVTDLDMPGIDGVAVLRGVQHLWPAAARVVLSGTADTEKALRAIQVAHQFITKPFEDTRLVEMLDRTWKLHQLLKSSVLRSAAGSLDHLPAMPRTFAALNTALSDPRVTQRRVSEIIETDPAIAAKIIQIASSSFFGSSGRIASVDTAVSFLGFRTIRGVTLMFEAFAFAGTASICGAPVEAMQSHALLTARIARDMFSDPRDKERAFLAGLLHTIGLLALAAARPEQIRGRQITPEADPCHPCGMMHGDLGAYLLGLWALPYDVIEAVAYFEAPWLQASPHFDAAGAVHIAHLLAHRATGHPELPLAEEYLTQIGKEQDLTRWEQTARELTR